MHCCFIVIKDQKIYLQDVLNYKSKKDNKKREIDKQREPGKEREKTDMEREREKERDKDREGMICIKNEQQIRKIRRQFDDLQPNNKYVKSQSAFDQAEDCNY